MLYFTTFYDKLVTWVRRLVKMFAGLDMEYKKGGILQTT